MPPPSRDRCSKVRSRCEPGPDWDEARPGFVEIDLVCHDGGNPAGPHAFTLTVTDIATGWTENRSVPDKTAKCVLAALNDIAYNMPFPILGVDSDNGSEFKFYEGQQFVGMDLHRRRSVLVRMTEAGEHLETVRILNDRDVLAEVMSRAGE